MERAWRIQCFVLLLDVFVNSFLLDLQNFTVYRGQNGSLFGYSVALLRNSNGDWILVGAPKSDDIFQPWVRRPGALFKCRLSWGKDSECEEVNVDSTGNTEETMIFHQRKIRFHPDKSNQWLGVSLDVDPEDQSSVLICAHRWKDNYLNIHLNGISHMNGICYQLNSSLSQSARKIPALTIRERLVNRQRYAEFSMGGLGMSAMFSGVSGYMLFGAPGMNDWSGGVVIERNGTNTNDIHYIEPPRSSYQDFQIGSSLAVGNYLFKSTKSIALGAPRAGKVLIYEWMDKSNHPVYTIEDGKVGGGFGSSLLTYRFANRYLDDIIIGAPYFSANYVNEGRIYVFKSRGILGFEQHQMIKGDSSAHAQFGASLGVLGDINGDGFNEIVVGAPYEEDGKGGVYVFNGWSSGIWPKYTQHIKASKINGLLRGFGISCSRPMAVQNKTVVAFGSHLSSQAVVMQSVDVLQIETSVQLLKKPKFCTLCVAFEICFKDNGNKSHSTAEVNLNFTVRLQDADIFHGVYLTTGLNKEMSVQHVEDSLTMTARDKSCSSSYVLVVDNFQAEVDGVEVLIEHALHTTNSSTIALNNFIGSRELPVIPPSYTYKFLYSTFCDEVRECFITVSLHQQWENLLNGTSLIMDPGMVTLVTTLTTTASGVSASDVTLFQIIPTGIAFVEIERANLNRTLPCTIEQIRLKCLIGSLKANETIVLRLIYEIRQAMVNTSTISMQSGLNFGLTNNSSPKVFEKYSVKAVRSVYADVKGYSRPTNYVMVNTHENNWIQFKHKFFLSLWHPGESEIVHFFFPVLWRTLTLSSSDVDIQHGKGDITCVINNGTNSSEELERIMALNQKICRTVGCDLLTCEIRPTSVRITLAASFNLVVNSRRLPFAEEITEHGYSTYMCYTSKFVIHGENPLCRNITTQIKDISLHETDGRIHYWFVTLAVFTGVAIILLLSFFLWKCGFFYRRAFHELKLRIEIQKLSAVHLLSAQRNSSSLDTDNDNETFVLTPYPSGSDDTQVMTPPPGYLEATHRTSNSSTDYFFNFDDDDGYLIPVFDSRKNDSSD
ncbi:integrin alpha-9 [Magallana gigas]|uniref:integrin alpha-9 n=1 Tax=Magallana gigas TaxID=29159 RepID=UPI00333EAAC7